mmetsp:Transcript_15626/g.28392  ORF Transcript_15626/g.28392 Transcript_15626/m.28392 type:complete len:164 (-) Transcript_15626:1986-2477(-)
MENLELLMLSGSVLDAVTIELGRCRTTLASVGNSRSQSTTHTSLSIVAVKFAAETVDAATVVQSFVIRVLALPVKLGAHLATATVAESSEALHAVVSPPLGHAERSVESSWHAVCILALSGVTPARVHLVRLPQSSIAIAEQRNRIACAVLKSLAAKIDATSC